MARYWRASDAKPLAIVLVGPWHSEVPARSPAPLPEMAVSRAEMSWFFPNFIVIWNLPPVAAVARAHFARVDDVREG
jgi:hypothetical protein